MTERERDRWRETDGHGRWIKISSTHTICSVRQSERSREHERIDILYSNNDLTIRSTRALMSRLFIWICVMKCLFVSRFTFNKRETMYLDCMSKIHYTTLWDADTEVGTLHTVNLSWQDFLPLILCRCKRSKTGEYLVLSVSKSGDSPKQIRA
jgi:hypothetical protein